VGAAIPRVSAGLLMYLPSGAGGDVEQGRYGWDKKGEYITDYIIRTMRGAARSAYLEDSVRPGLD